MMTGSYRTTAGGFASILSGAGVLLNVIAQHGNPLADVQGTLSGIGLILTGFALLAARDNRVSDQAAGVRPEPAAQPEIRRAQPVTGHPGRR
jgi:hypothetical protein